MCIQVPEIAIKLGGTGFEAVGDCLRQSSKQGMPAVGLRWTAGRI